MKGPLALGQPVFTTFNFGYTPVAPAVRLMASDGSTSIARSTSGIINLGGNTRGKLLTPPSVTGWYISMWDDSNGTPYPDEEIWVSTILTDILAAAVAGLGGGGGGGGLSGAPIVLPAGGVSPVVTQSFFIKRGDNEPLIFAVTELDTGGVQHLMDVTGWTGHFKLRAVPDIGTIIIDQPFYISDANGDVTTDGTGGLLGYDWGRAASRVGETDREGLFLAEFECHRSDGTKKTYPTTSDQSNNREYIVVNFVPDLDDAGSH
jgi:hypothetical protein